MRKMPAHFSKTVELTPGLQIYLEAFYDLTSERYDADGRIPWSRVEQWAKSHRLDTDASDTLHHHIRAMDLAFLRWKSDKASKRGHGKRRPKVGEPGGDSQEIQ